MLVELDFFLEPSVNLSSYLLLRESCIGELEEECVSVGEDVGLVDDFLYVFELKSE